MATVQKYLLGSATTLATAALDSQVNNALVSCTVFDNTIGQTGDGYTLCDVQLTVAFSSTPTANTGLSLWFLAALDGTNYESGSSSLTPARLPDVVFPVIAQTAAQIINRRVLLPWGKMTPLLKNEAGQTTFSSGNTLKIRPVTPEMI